MVVNITDLIGPLDSFIVCQSEKLYLPKAFNTNPNKYHCEVIIPYFQNLFIEQGGGGIVVTGSSKISIDNHLCYMMRFGCYCYSQA